MNDRQAEAGPFALFLGRKKRVEDLLDIVLGDALARVPHRQPHVVPRDEAVRVVPGCREVAQFHVQLSAIFPHRVGGIGGKVHNDLLHLNRVSKDHALIIFDIHLYGNGRRYGGPRSFIVSLTMLLTSSGFFTRSLLRLESEHLFYQVLANARVHDPVEAAGVAAPFGKMAPDDIGESQDSRQNIVEVMGDATGEGTQGIHLLGLTELPLNLLAHPALLYQPVISLFQLLRPLPDALLQLVVSALQGLLGLDFRQGDGEIAGESLPERDGFGRETILLFVVELKKPQCLPPYPQRDEGHRLKPLPVAPVSGPGLPVLLGGGGKEAP